MNIKKLILCILIVFIVKPLFSEGIRLAKTLPFQAGERCRFRITVFGMYVSDLVFTVDGLTKYQDRTAVISTLKIDTTEFVSGLYKIHNKEISFTLTSDLTSLYCEKYIEEAQMLDLITCSFPTNQNPAAYQVNCVSKLSNVKKFTIENNGILRNFPDLILLIRSLDMDYYITSKKTFEVYFLDGLIKITRFAFKVNKKKIRYKDKEVEAICVEEAAGNGMAFYMLDDTGRTPVQLTVSAFKVLGIGSINIYGDLIEYSEGSQKIR